MDDLGGKPTIFRNIHIGDYTTQLNEDYNKPLQGSNNQYNGK